MLVIGAQFLSSLADNALLIAAIGLLMERMAPAWMTPALRLVFYGAFVLLAAFAGAAADAAPKGRVMFATGLVKLGGCVLLVLHLHPVLAYAFVGLGAAAYSPAKYGILPELLHADELVTANAWMEISTVLSILLGVSLGSYLMDPANPVPAIGASRAITATGWIAIVYLMAAIASAAVPANPASSPQALAHPFALVKRFCGAVRILWRDPVAQISLAVTSLFWAISAALQFIILRWAEQSLHLALAQAALLQVAVAIGMVGGAALASRWVPLRRALGVLPLGLALAASMMLMTLVTQVWSAAALLVAIGILSGLFLIPMNALLQQRGHELMHPGQSIAVQNFSENLASLLLLAIYGTLLYLDAPILQTILYFGGLVAIGMAGIMHLHRRNRQQRPVRVPAEQF